MDICGNKGNLNSGFPRLGWKACSACAGDYEDPDRSVPGGEEEDEEEQEN